MPPTHTPFTVDKYAWNTPKSRFTDGAPLSGPAVMGDPAGAGECSGQRTRWGEPAEAAVGSPGVVLVPPVVDVDGRPGDHILPRIPRIAATC
jgi:hypothetical protein